MDWLKQSEEMISLWSETQQKMWSNWLSAMQDFAQPQATGVWEKTIEAWEQAVKNMLETQAQWARMWASSLTATKGVPKEAIEGAGQLKEITERWVEFQQQLWQDWFKMVRALSPSEVTVSQGKETPSIFQAWQDTLQQAMDAQIEWVRAWAAGRPDQKSEK